MKAEIIRSLTQDFERHAYEFEGVECWDARSLQALLGYSRWENFVKVIQKAKTSCQTSGTVIDDHFREITKMVSTGSDAKRPIEDVRLTRYACYLIAQNGDPSKEEIAFAQSYFAVQTRKFEILEQRINQIERLQARGKLTETERQFSGIIYQRGVDDRGFAIIRSKGDQALFGGRTTSDMKKKLGVSENHPLADFLPTITIKAKDFATEITLFKVKEDEQLIGQTLIQSEHEKNNREVRGLLTKQGIYPENLPAAEDIKKVDRAMKSESKRLERGTKRLGRKAQPNNDTPGLAEG
ncbi:MAG TPA: DNA damage-inducible protein D [Candidatus Kapabacteria bacterium]|nr:DNA damage-inducible protein D [Candidatus Kapabacteria bacterium]